MSELNSQASYQVHLIHQKAVPSTPAAALQPTAAEWNNRNWKTTQMVEKLRVLWWSNHYIPSSLVGEGGENY